MHHTYTQDQKVHVEGREKKNKKTKKEVKHFGNMKIFTAQSKKERWWGNAKGLHNSVKETRKHH